MARRARGDSLNPDLIQIAHVTSRCVRRAFLCGYDEKTGQSFEHRRQWIANRMEQLAAIFAIDCLTFSIMSNHLHEVLRSRPDIVRSWSDEEVARRWLTLCPPHPGKAFTEEEHASLVADKKRIAELRRRLSDISWWQRMLCQKIAAMANREDGCTGRFWEGRFKHVLLLDEASLLACSMYVDLNPVRAAMAESLENSEFTGAKARIDDLKAAGLGPPGQAGFTEDAESPPSRKERWERTSVGRPASGWLSPIEVDEASDPIGSDASVCGRRASLKGFLSMPMTKYLELLDWTGRQLRSGKRGRIPASVAPILDRLGLAADHWLEAASNFDKLFKQAAGNSVALAAEAERRGQHWMQCPGSSCFV